VAKLPLSLSKAMDAWKEVTAQTDRSASITLAGDARLVEIAQRELSDGGVAPATWVRPVAELPGLSSVPGEILVVFTSAEGEAEVLSSFGQWRPKGGAVVVVDDGSAATGKSTYLGKGCSRLSFSDTPHGWKRLFDACAQAAGDHAAALGRRYPALRAAAARRVVYRFAGQNGLVGLAFFIPGSDMPAMTLNQIKMILSIAGIYGEEIDRERAVELAGVVCAGFGMRAVARSLVRSMPGLGWLLRAGTGYSATVALGLGAIHYFEKGAPASTSRVVALAGLLKS
jgi:uncharacterized protein (DUF697 family)